MLLGIRFACNIFKSFMKSHFFSIISRVPFMDRIIGSGYFRSTPTEIIIYKVSLQGFDSSPFRNTTDLKYL